MGWVVKATPRPLYPPGKTQHTLYRRLGEPHSRSGRVRKISPPPGFHPRTAQPVASRYTDWAIPALCQKWVTFDKHIWHKYTVRSDCVNWIIWHNTRKQTDHASTRFSNCVQYIHGLFQKDTKVSDVEQSTRHCNHTSSHDANSMTGLLEWVNLIVNVALYLPWGCVRELNRFIRGFI